MLPLSLPLFPLPNVVLFPNVYLPLHIFEPRYRQMVHDALNGDRTIGMVLLRPGYEAQYEARPAVYEVGCAGGITHVDRLPDGRFNMVLRGLGKFRIVREHPASDPGTYRVADVAELSEQLSDRDREALKTQRAKIEELLAPLFSAARAASPLPEIMADDDLVNALAQYLALEPIEKQALLELEGPLARSRSLLELVEMKALADRGLGEKGTVH